MSEKLLLELYDRVATLEKKVAVLEMQSGKKQLDETPNEEAIAEVKGKYRYLSDYLLNSKEDTIVLTFAEIEEILQEELPPSARQHRALWANSKSHSIALAWMNVGYRTAEVDMEKQRVKFEKVRAIKW